MLGNIIRDELLAHRVNDFVYQIWHIEELSWLAQFSGDQLVEWVAEKFLPKNRSMGLNSFVADKSGQDFLRPVMYMPQGDTRAFKILKELSDDRM
jgi:hypothetical protein